MKERTFEPAVGDTPEAIFDRQWASALLSAVWANSACDFEEENRLAWVELYEAYHGSTGKRPTQQALATRFGLLRDQVRDIL